MKDTKDTGQAFPAIGKEKYFFYARLGLAVDVSRIDFPRDFFEHLDAKMRAAFDAMEALEKGLIANPDEQRMVGHYWLRKADLAPRREIQDEINRTQERVRNLAREVHAGGIKGQHGVFTHLLLIGIGGSALGPQFVGSALRDPRADLMKLIVLDNTDPDGIQLQLCDLRAELGRTLCLVISKSGETRETRNAMLEVQAAYQELGLDFARHAIAVTSSRSALDDLAKKEAWLERLPMWDWVGGRTSETSAVGLLPAALQGIDIGQLLAGAAACDEATRSRVVANNPAALLALAWYSVGNGKGEKTMVVLPYKDRLALFSRYLQQLVMESLGKAIDLDGEPVEQGITVYGNKGSTDQHAYVQQLRDGRNDFFVTFIEVLRDQDGKGRFVEEGVTCGDYLSGFLQGTRQALYENGRQSITLTIDQVSPFSIGILIALFERAVGYYASLIHINAYHQPGVEAGKKAAARVIDLQKRVVAFLKENRGREFLVEEIADHIGDLPSADVIFKVCEHLTANPGRGIESEGPRVPADVRYRFGS